MTLFESTLTISLFRCIPSWKEGTPPFSFQGNRLAWKALLIPTYLAQIRKGSASVTIDPFLSWIESNTYLFLDIDLRIGLWNAYFRNLFLLSKNSCNEVEWVNPPLEKNIFQPSPAPSVGKNSLFPSSGWMKAFFFLPTLPTSLFLNP